MTLFHCEQARQLTEALAVAFQERNALQARLEALGAKVCPFCDALTLDLDGHTDWHRAQEQLLQMISEKAGRYVPPPVYGG